MKSALFRLRYRTRGGHTHVTVWASIAEHPETSLGKCGELLMRNEEWERLGVFLNKASWFSADPVVEIVCEDETPT